MRVDVRQGNFPRVELREAGKQVSGIHGRKHLARAALAQRSLPDGWVSSNIFGRSGCSNGCPIQDGASQAYLCISQQLSDLILTKTLIRGEAHVHCGRIEA